MSKPTSLLLVVLLAWGCATTPEDGTWVAHLGARGGDPGGFATLRARFQDRNPDHDVVFHGRAKAMGPVEQPRVVFVQAGEALAAVDQETSQVTVGDIVLLRPGQDLRADTPLDLLAFSIPAPLPSHLPSFVRADWDPRITDTPGGCATETGAYRRILLTWLEEKGPYVYHGLNAHRVRITDSFTHYHPLDGGFDEFYLVQMVQPGARVLTSTATSAIEARIVARDEVGDLLRSRPLSVGDLVYLPRGTIHRGLDGVLAQVITTPGFRPGAEIGVDHHLRAINEALDLRGDEALPYHRLASEAPVVR